MGIVPENAIARQFRDEAGRLHQTPCSLGGRGLSGNGGNTREDQIGLEIHRIMSFCRDPGESPGPDLTWIPRMTEDARNAKDGNQ